jgi:hypothetical protein
VTLILFDLTYLTLRPFYLRHLPVVTRTYDPVLGIQPHPVTEKLLSETAVIQRNLARDPSFEASPTQLTKLRALTYRVIWENPFGRANRSHKAEAFKEVIAAEAGDSFADAGSRNPWGDAADSFWPSQPGQLKSRLELFHRELRPLLETNYFRAVDRNGHLKDLFWLIDLPFLVFFWLEFGIRWTLAIRRRVHTRWFFFPILNWYDLIGLVPYTQLRIFRLFRVASIYMRLHRSDLTRVGQDAISRGVAYVSNIIVEEVSDAVAVRLLNEMQTEIRNGTARQIVDDLMETKRSEVEDILVVQIRQIVASEETQERIRNIVRLNLDAAAASSTALRAIPLPRSILQRIVRATGEVVLGTILQSLDSTLQSEAGEKAARELVGGVLDKVIDGPLRSELDGLSKDVSLDVIERVKQAVVVKKWAQLKEQGN